MEGDLLNLYTDNCVFFDCLLTMYCWYFQVVQHQAWVLVSTQRVIQCIRLPSTCLIAF